MSARPPWTAPPGSVLARGTPVTPGAPMAPDASRRPHRRPGRPRGVSRVREQVPVPDQDAVGADEVYLRRPAERVLHAGEREERRQPVRLDQLDDEVGVVQPRVVPVLGRLPLVPPDDGARRLGGRRDRHDHDMFPGGQADDAGLPVGAHPVPQAVPAEPGRQLLVHRRYRRGGGRLAEADQVAGEHQGQRGHQPGPHQPRREQPARKDRGERKYLGELAGAVDVADPLTEHVDGEADQHAGHENLIDQVVVAEEPAYPGADRPAGQREADQMEQDQEDREADLAAEEVGAEQHEEPVCGVGEVARHLAGYGEQRAHRPDQEAADGVDQ